MDTKWTRTIRQQRESPTRAVYRNPRLAGDSHNRGNRQQRPTGGEYNWHYCDCADPTTSGPGVQAVVVDPSEPPSGANVKREKLQVLARPYPRAVAGTPRSFGFDPDTGRFELEYSARTPKGDALGRRLDARVDTEVLLPRIQYPEGYSVQARGADVVSEPGARVLRLERLRRSRSVEVAVTPKP